MIRATTPTHIFELPFDINEFVDKVLITYKQDEIVLEKTLEDCNIEKNILSYKLTQEETNKFNNIVFVKIQIRVITKGGESLASDEYSKSVQDVLNDKVL